MAKEQTDIAANSVRSSLAAFQKILQAMRLASVDVQSKAGLSTAQLLTLGHLASGAALSINELAELTMTDRSSVAEVVDRLAGRRLVRRAWSAEDRRRAVVTITQAGRQAVERAPTPPARWLVRALVRMPAPELQALAIGLERLTAELGMQEIRRPHEIGKVPEKQQESETAAGAPATVPAVGTQGAQADHRAVHHVGNAASGSGARAGTGR